MAEVVLKPPLDVVGEATGPAAKRALTLEIASKSPLAPEKLAELELQTKKTLEASARHTQPLRSRLRELNDFLEGVAQDVQEPFPDASNTDVRLAMGAARTMRAQMVRALVGDPERVFVASTGDNSERENANKVEASFNWKAAHDNGLVDAIKDGIIPTFRDGLAFLHGSWEKKVEQVYDYRTYLTAEDFAVDYPTPESAGLSEEKYADLIHQLLEPDNILEVCFEHKQVTRNDAKFSIVPLARFYWWPLSIKQLDQAELYAVRMDESEATMRRKIKQKEYREDAGKEVLAAGAKRDGMNANAWETSRDYIEGLSRSGGDVQRKDYENYLVVLNVDADGDDVPEKYLGVFNLEAGKFLSFDRYRLRKNRDFLVPLRFHSRDDRLLGHSLLYDGLDIWQEINDLHRHRNNARLITDAPGFKAEEGIKEDVEDELANWRPGVVVWVPDGKMNSVTQFALENRSNTQNSVDEEGSLRAYGEFVVGPTQGLSGQETQEDPNAPATKHLSKIRQAGFRIDDYLEEYKRAFPAVGRLGLDLYYQYGQRDIEYQAKNPTTGKLENQKVERALFGSDALTIALNGRSVIMSPEFEMERVMALRQGLTPEVLMLNPAIPGELWNRFIDAARVSDPEKLKVTPPQLPPLPGMAPGMPGGLPMAGAPPAAGGAPNRILAALKPPLPAGAPRT